MATVKVKRRVKVLAKAASASVGSAAVHAGKQAKNGNSQGFRLVRPLFSEPSRDRQTVHHPLCARCPPVITDSVQSL